MPFTSLVKVSRPHPSLLRGLYEASHKFVKGIYEPRKRLTKYL